MAAESLLSRAQPPFLILLTLHTNIYSLLSSPAQSRAVVEIKEDHQMCTGRGYSEWFTTRESATITCVWQRLQEEWEWESFITGKRGR